MCMCVKECVDNAQTPFRGLVRKPGATWKVSKATSLAQYTIYKIPHNGGACILWITVTQQSSKFVYML